MGCKARIKAPDSVTLVEKDDTQYEGAVARIKDKLAPRLDEANALEDRTVGYFPRKARGDTEEVEEVVEEEKGKICRRCLWSCMSCVRWHMWAGNLLTSTHADGNATKEGEAKAIEDDPIGDGDDDDDDDDDDEKEEEEDEEEDEADAADNSGSDKDGDENDDEDSEEEGEEEGEGEGAPPPHPPKLNL
eukprot:jgi/Tetstr1/455694/TSEL_042502.t1